MKVRVDVTEQDILNGTRYDSVSCPIALALKRKFPNKRLTVGCFGIYEGQEFCYNLSKKVSQFITDYDGCEETKPFYFFINFKDNNEN